MGSSKLKQLWKDLGKGSDKDLPSSEGVVLYRDKTQVVFIHDNFAYWADLEDGEMVKDTMIYWKGSLNIEEDGKQWVIEFDMKNGKWCQVSDKMWQDVQGVEKFIEPQHGTELQEEV